MIKEYKLRAQIHTVSGSMKPCLDTFYAESLARIHSRGFVLTKLDNHIAYRYFYAGKEVEVTDIIWNKDKGELTYLFKEMK